MHGSGSVFRRGGQKKELFSNAGDHVDDFEKDKEEKLIELLRIWREPRMGNHLSGGVWKHHNKAAEMFVQRGDQLSKMGFLQRGKLHLQIEEVVYLLERGDLILIVELSEKNGRVVSVQEAYELMACCGVSVEEYMVYSKLKRDGFIVKRYPSRWQLLYDEHPDHIWGDAEVTRVQSGCSTNGWTSTSTTDILGRLQQQSTRSKQKTGRRKDLGDTLSRSWWGIMTQLPWLQHLPDSFLGSFPRCVVAAPAQDLLQSRLPHFHPFTTLPRSAEWDVLQNGNGVKPVFEVYMPNQKFSKKKPSPVSFRICLCTQMPTLPEIQSMDVMSEGVPVKFAAVDKGDVTFVEFEKVELATIY